MELNEAFSRIFGRHRLLVVLFVVAGLVIGLAMHWHDKVRYQAAARLVITASDPSSAAVATGLADTVRALATGTDTLDRALLEVGVNRNIATLAANDVNVQSVGASGVISLGVTDANPEVAVALANALAEAVVTQRVAASAGAGQTQLTTVNHDIDLINKRMSALQDKLSAAVGQADTADPARANAATAAREQVIAQLGVLNQQLSALTTERFALLNEASVSSARVVDLATGADPVATGRLADVALALLIGLGVGVAMAALVESIRPSVVGLSAIARTLGVPVLATSRVLRGCWRRADVSRIAAYVELAATTAGVHRVEFVTVDRNLDLATLLPPLAERLPATMEAGSVEDAQPGELPRLFPRAKPSPARGLVAVVPLAVRRDRLDPIHDLRTISGWPLLGVIVVRRNRLLESLVRRRERTLVAPHSKPHDPAVSPNGLRPARPERVAK